MLAAGLAIDPHARALAKPYAQLLAARGALQAALDVLAEVPPDAETTALRAAILHRIGNHAEAASAYEDALREQPEQAVWWTGLAIAREHNQEPRKALQAYRRAARLQLSDPVREYVEHRMQALQPRDGQ
jgi:MSHA biogenesis protein MshN